MKSRKSKKNNAVSAFLFLIPAFLFFLGAGCASHEKSLELDNVMHLKAEKDAREKARLKADAEKKKQEEEARKKETLTQNLAGLIKESKFDPPELVFFEAPSSFSRLTEEDLNKPGVRAAIQERFPGCTAVWKSKTLDVTLYFGKAPLEKERILSLTAAQFHEDVLKMGEQFDQYYQSSRQSHASHDEFQLSGLKILRVMSKYIQSGEWWADDREVYFYTPDYRVNMMLSGPENDLQSVRPALSAELKKFYLRLAKQYPAGIPFRES